MSDEVRCDYCKKLIPESVWKKRNGKAKSICCNRACAVALRKQQGQYKAMSDAGSSARSQAVSKSNQEKPRRKRKDAPIFA